MASFSTEALACLNDEKYSDFTIVCAGEEYKVHRVILVAHSKWFDRVFSSDFKEAKEGRVELKEDDPKCVARMIRFFYDGTMPTEPTEIYVGSDNTLSIITSYAMTYAAMYVIADKYEAPGLKNEALQRVRAFYKGELSVPQLKVGVQVVYHGIALPDSDRSLRDVVVEAWMRSIKCAFRRADGPTRRLLGDLCRADEEFLKDLQVRLFQGFLDTVEGLAQIDLESSSKRGAESVKMD